MKFVLFYHSLVSDWNHGNAHFLRGVVRALGEFGHEVAVYEPADGWSRQNLVVAHGEAPLDAFHRAFPGMRSTTYDLATLDLDAALDGADVVLVHEWNPPALVERLGRARAYGGSFRLLFHDTHHRSVSDAQSLAGVDLAGYDGVLAFGEVIRQRYLREGWTQQAWTWHEAADTALFHPLPPSGSDGDVVWIGNWGDGERSREIRHYFVDPVSALGLRAKVYGVRYPSEALDILRSKGIGHGGWLANHCVPATFNRYRFTVHIPRRPYVSALRGIPTIRVFEALACGIPLVSAYWADTEGLFGEHDFLLARDPEEMRRHMHALRHDPDLRAALSRRGQAAIEARHTCRHRAQELLAIVHRLGVRPGGQQERHVA